MTSDNGGMPMNAARLALHIPVEISIPLLCLAIGEQKIDQAFARATARWKTSERIRALYDGDQPTFEGDFASSQLRRPVSVALGELINRRMAENA